MIAADSVVSQGGAESGRKVREVEQSRVLRSQMLIESQ